MSKTEKAQVAEQNATSKFANADNICTIDVKRVVKHETYDTIVHLIGYDNCNASYVYAWTDDRDLVLIQDSNCARNVALHAIIEAIVDNFNGGPVGIETLSYFVGEELGTLEDVYEPYLLQRGFIVRTPRGRVATEKAYKHLGRAYKKGKNDKNIKQENFFKDE